MTPPTDDELFAAFPEHPDAFDPPPADDGLRERIFARTARRVAATRRMRRVTVVAALILCFAAGVMTGPWIMPGHGPGRSTAGSERNSTPVAPPPGEIVDASPPARPTAAQIEDRARRASNEQRLLLLKLAGDRYLNDDVDVESALRCYRAVLAAAPPTDRKRFDPTDSWLLASLRQSNP